MRRHPMRGLPQPHGQTRALQGFRISAITAATLVLGGMGQVQAFEFKNDYFTGNLDSTITYGALWRAQSRDQSLIGISNGGTARTPNGDDGNLNYDKRDLVSNLLKGSHELEIKRGDFGLFVRGAWFYDQQAHEDEKYFGPTARDRIQDDAQILDAFVSARTQIGGKKFSIRGGYQVVSWGESTFIQNGINTINSVDVAKLRAPGSEVKDGLIPSPMIWASQELTDNLSMEAFYLFNFDKVKIDPRGTFFSSSDVVSDDGDRAIVTFGRRKDQHFPVTNPRPEAALVPLLNATNPGGPFPFDPASSIWVTRSADRNPSDNGQAGVAFRYLAPGLGNAEFGFYAMQYHNRTPLFSVTKAGKNNGTTSTAGTYIPAISAPNVLTGGASGLTNSLYTGNAAVTKTLAGNAATAALALAFDGSTRYYLEYPEKDKLYGISLNVQGPAGLALQGEVSYRPNQPVQLAVTDLILAGLNLPSQMANDQTKPDLGLLAGSDITGYKRVKMYQAQMTATKAIPSILGAEQVVIVGEVGYNHLDLPDNLRFEGPGAGLPILPIYATSAALGSVSAGAVQNGGFTTRDSWGYRIVARAEYAGVFGSLNVAPRFAFSHDVSGVGPNFNEGVKAATLGVTFNYQQKWQADIAYTSFFGGRSYCGTDIAATAGGQAALAAGQSLSYCTGANPLSDRDFVALNISYSF